MRRPAVRRRVRLDRVTSGCAITGNAGPPNGAVLRVRLVSAQAMFGNAIIGSVRRRRAASDRVKVDQDMSGFAITGNAQRVAQLFAIIGSQRLISRHRRHLHRRVLAREPVQLSYERMTFVRSNHPSGNADHARSSQTNACERRMLARFHRMVHAQSATCTCRFGGANDEPRARIATGDTVRTCCGA